MELKLSDRMWLVLNYLIVGKITLASEKDPTLTALRRRGLANFELDPKYEGVWWFATIKGHRIIEKGTRAHD